MDCDEEVQRVQVQAWHGQAGHVWAGDGGHPQVEHGLSWRGHVVGSRLGGVGHGGHVDRLLLHNCGMGLFWPGRCGRVDRVYVLCGVNIDPGLSTFHMLMLGILVSAAWGTICLKNFLLRVVDLFAP